MRFDAAPRARRSGGVALVTAMLVVSMASMAAVAMVSRQQLDIRRTSNMLLADQAYLLALGVESWAKGVLGKDAGEGGADSASNPSAMELAPIEVHGGEVAGDIRDLDALFSLNNLIQNGKVSQVDLIRFKRLLEVLELPVSLADAVVDWMDADIEPRFPDGAEDDIYSRREPAYRTANRPMASVTELRLVKGVDGETYDRLAPFVAALPSHTSINVNAAPTQVLMALARGMTREDAEAVIQVREHTPFPDVESFLKHDALAGLEMSPLGLEVNSGFFQVHARATFQQIHVRLVTTLERTVEGHVRVIQRHRAGPSGG